MIPSPLDPSKPFVLQYDKVPPRWRLVRDAQQVDLAWGIMLFGAPGCDWALHLYLGTRVIGIERTSD